MEKNVFLSIGTNLGDREQNLRGALLKISTGAGEIVAASGIYETEPWGFDSENNFLNQAVKISSVLDPESLISVIHQIEKEMGRARKAAGYSSRIIDIDILVYGNLIVDRPGLKIPHPGIPERKFVLVPLAEIAPGLIHPVSGKTISLMLQECADKKKVKKFVPGL